MTYKQLLDQLRRLSYQQLEQPVIVGFKTGFQRVHHFVPSAEAETTDPLEADFFLDTAGSPILDQDDFNDLLGL